MELVGATALVTGGSGGLGSAVARALTDRGASVVLTGRRPEPMRQLVDVIPNARMVVADLANSADVERLIEETVGVDVLVASAALPATGLLSDFSVEELDRAMTVNLRAPLRIAQALSAAMAKKGRGHLVFISSIGGKLPSRGLSIYSATKYGVRGFAACLRYELADSGVGVSTVFPGSIRDAGMLVEAALPVAPGTKGVTAAQVAAGVINAIENNLAEIDVADRAVRIAARLAAIAPRLYARISDRPESQEYARQLAEGLRPLR